MTTLTSTSPPIPVSAMQRVGIRTGIRWNTLWLCAIILFGAFVVRLWNLGTQSLWHDEAWSVMSAYQPLRPIDSALQIGCGYRGNS